MGTRRTFLKQVMGAACAGALAWAAGIAEVFAGAARRVLPRGTPLESLRNSNPAELDTRNLSVTPLEDFRTMGITDHRVDLEKWRLEIEGRVHTPLRLSYEEPLPVKHGYPLRIVAEGYYGYDWIKYASRIRVE